MDRPEAAASHPAPPERPLRLRAITCDILSRPVYLCAATSRNIVDVHHLSAALHVEPVTLRERIQEQIDATPAGYDAVVLAYGLCGGGTDGIVARDTRVVLARAHDCITIFLGGRDRYEREFEAAPGTYWYLADQMDRGNDLKGWLLGDAARASDARAAHDDYAARFGARNAEYLMETLGEWRARYERGAFIDVGAAPESDAPERARAEAERRGWRFERLDADLGLVRRLIDGPWDEDFQVLAPGETLAMSFDERIVEPLPAPAAASPPALPGT